MKITTELHTVIFNPMVAIRIEMGHREVEALLKALGEPTDPALRGIKQAVQRGYDATGGKSR